MNILSFILKNVQTQHMHMLQWIINTFIEYISNRQAGY